MIQQDNFEKIAGLLQFPEGSDVFYHIELIGRKKDNPKLDASQKSFGSYFVTSLEMFNAIKNEIISKCVAKKCRAYINLNPKSRKAVGFALMHKLMTMAETNNFMNLFSTMASAAGTVNGVKDMRTFVIDIDNCNNEYFDAVLEVEEIVRSCRRSDMTDDPVIESLKTVSGFHVITKPFDIADFNKKKYKLEHCTAEAKTNSPTLLFVRIKEKDDEDWERILDSNNDPDGRLCPMHVGSDWD